MDEKIIRSEKELKNWFMDNYESLGYSNIIRKDIGIFPDFIMLKNGKEIKVELETISSNFLLHNHDIKDVDEVICTQDDAKLSIPVKEVKFLRYVPKMVRVSATIGKDTLELIKDLLKDGKYRNKSHIIEKAIEMLAKEKNVKKK